MTRLSDILAAAEERYRLLLEEASTLLRNFDTAAPEDFDEMMVRRQGIIDDIQKIDEELATLSKEPPFPAGSDDGDALGRFRATREEATRRIVEMDSLVIALARERIGRLQQEMSALGRGKTALHGYERSGREQHHKFNDTV
ncbi:hypothetical protein [Geobacter pickeringii]|uniref:Flagellar biosynthesis protein FlgN n=1 Tax=Geobacter pickeringii TaxID=345632 RepID=A0A0B5BEC1_9BACT|nr:hypothetical protein [Geobacter pickeringii]AJE02401.1 hypothetical protein GPICK_02510 [Geobacter pickeringii]